MINKQLMQWYLNLKSFVLSYSKAIRYELKAKGITVTALCPGATRTNFFEKEGTNTPANAMSPKEVAELAIHGLNKNVAVIIPGIMNRLLQLFPQKIKMYAVAKMKDK